MSLASLPAAVTLRQLRAFVAVAEELHFGRAAARLHITQPPLSRQIEALESALGVRLLERGPHAVALTAAGAVALPAFRQVLAQALQAVQAVAACRREAPVLRLGLPGWLQLEGLASLAGTWQQEGLVDDVQTRRMASHEAVAAVRRGRLDAALVAAPVVAPELAIAPLADIRMAALLPAGAPLARRRVVSLQDLQALVPFHRFPRALGPALWDHFERQYHALGFRPRREVVAEDTLGVMARIGAGQGCTLVPEPLAVRQYAGVARRRLREPVTMTVALLTPPSMSAALRERLVTGLSGSLAAVVHRPSRRVRAGN